MNLYEHIKEDTNFKYTENGAVTHKSTLDNVLDMFAMGGAYRNRTDKEVEELFGDAYRQDKELALKCLFYLRDCRGGQGERRFFRVAYKWLCHNDPSIAYKFLSYIPEYGRWDDLIDIGYSCAGTVSVANDGHIYSIANKVINIIANQMDLDNVSKTPSLLAKWMPSENASSAKTKAKARWIINNIGITPKEYRLRLSSIRKKINVLERLMSENRWDEIEFDKIPSIAGMRYRNVFAVKEVTAARYKAFMESKTTKVNASVLNPVDIANKVINNTYISGWWKESTDIKVTFKQVEIDALCKYWDNLKDYYQGKEENAIAVVDVSGSMTGQPIAAAVGMGAYVATKSHGPFANHFITFSDNPELVEFEGDNIVDKIARCITADWGYSTNIEAVMDLLLDTAVKHNIPQSDLPARLYIFSDMEFNRCVNMPNYLTYETLFESIERKWNEAGYEMPTITFWNLDSRQDNISAIGDKFNYISGFSMSQMEAVMAGKTAVDMMLEVLLSERYADIRVYEQLGASTIACSEN